MPRRFSALAIPLLSALSFLGLFFCEASAAQEDPQVAGMTSFRADVTVRADSTLDVREEFTVRNAATSYKRGFWRDMPVSPDDRWDTRYVGEYQPDNGIRVKVVEVTEDGASVGFDEGAGYSYSHLWIGPQGAPFDSGEHRFVIRYTVESALTLGDRNDVLYWNALGHGHDDRVAEAILVVHLPARVALENVHAEPRIGVRGPSGARNSDSILEPLEGISDGVGYRATNLRRRQSLSLALIFPSGAIHKPPFDVLKRGGWVLLVPAALFLFYLVAWIRIGPEPKPGTIVPRYDPPEGLSPAAVRFVTTGTTDGRTLAAVIAQLAAQGCIRVEPVDGKYKLSRLMSDRATEASLADEERQLLVALFDDAPELMLTPSLDQRNQAQNARYVNVIHQELTRRFAGKYMTRHIGVIALGVLATFVCALLLAVTAQGRDPGGAFFFTMWILFCGLMLGMMIEISFATAWRTALRSGKGGLMLLPGTAAIAVFGGAIALLLTKLASGVSLQFAIMVAALVAVNLGWAPFLKRRTKLGRELLDQIAGFRLFLEKVHQDALNRLNPADATPQDLDRFLSYAIALEVKEAWGDHLAQTFLASTVISEA